MKKVAVIMGSKSDAELLKKTFDVLKEFDIACTVKVLSAHRTPQEAASFASDAIENGFGVIICAAGKAAHLAGVVAAHTILPVIGLPIKSGSLGGIDALLSVVQMPSGVPVATVAVDGAENAALLAVQILAVANENLAQKLIDYKQQLKQNTINADEEITNYFR